MNRLRNFLQIETLSLFYMKRQNSGQKKKNKGESKIGLAKRTEKQSKHYQGRSQSWNKQKCEY